MRTLVAEDFEPLRCLISSLIQTKPGWHVVSEVADGLAAVQKAQELAPDLILLDIGLPKLNGLEAARRIREVAPNSKILFVSTHLDSDFVEAALATGACGYVFKADAGSELVQAVEAALQGKRFVSRRLKGIVPAEAEETRAPVGLAGSDVLASSAAALPRERDITRRHEVQFYADDESLLNGFAHFIDTALKAGKTTIVVATEPHRAALLARLQARGLDVATAIGQGRYISVDCADMPAKLMVGGVPDRDRFLSVVPALLAAAAPTAKGSPPPIALCGEGMSLLWARGAVEAAIRLEQLGSELVEMHDVEILCGYPSIGLFSAEDARRICAAHTAART